MIVRNGRHTRLHLTPIDFGDVVHYFLIVEIQSQRSSHVWSAIMVTGISRLTVRPWCRPQIATLHPKATFLDHNGWLARLVDPGAPHLIAQLPLFTSLFDTAQCPISCYRANGAPTTAACCIADQVRSPSRLWLVACIGRTSIASREVDLPR
jgi:hypothetical protein